MMRKIRDYGFSFIGYSILTTQVTDIELRILATIRVAIKSSLMIEGVEER